MANWRNYKIKNSAKYIIIGIILLVCVFLSGGIIFYHRKKQQIHKNSVTTFNHITTKQPHFKKLTEAETIEAKKHEESLKNEVKQLKEQEKELKTQFDNAQSLEEKGKIKKTLTALQKELFDKKEFLKNHAPTSASSQLSEKENIDKKKLADSLKRKIHKKIADLESGKDDIDYEKGIQSDPVFIFYFARHYLDEKDNQEISVLIGKIEKLQEAKKVRKKAKEDRELENNPKLFKYSLGMSTERNGGWNHYQKFLSKYKGKDFFVYIPDNHPALNNVLFHNGWGTNSEIGEFYLLEGIEEPTELHYWNVEKQEMEIVPEEKAEQLIQEDKRIFYEKFVSLEENITIDYFTDRERERERANLDQFKWLLKLFGNHDVRSLINLLTFN